jgi:hypothetical protein
MGGAAPPVIAYLVIGAASTARLPKTQTCQLPEQQPDHTSRQNGPHLVEKGTVARAVRAYRCGL